MEPPPVTRVISLSPRVKKWREHANRWAPRGAFRRGSHPRVAPPASITPRLRAQNCSIAPCPSWAGLGQPVSPVARSTRIPLNAESSPSSPGCGHEGAYYRLSGIWHCRFSRPAARPHAGRARPGGSCFLAMSEICCICRESRGRRVFRTWLQMFPRWHVRQSSLAPRLPVADRVETTAHRSRAQGPRNDKSSLSRDTS